TSTSRRPPLATCVTEFDPGWNDTILPFSGRWGVGPASALYTVLPRMWRPVGTMLPKAITSVIAPSRVTLNTRLWWPSVTRNPLRYFSIAYWTPDGTSNAVAGGWAVDHAPISPLEGEASDPSRNDWTRRPLP